MRRKFFLIKIILISLCFVGVIISLFLYYTHKNNNSYSEYANVITIDGDNVFSDGLIIKSDEVLIVAPGTRLIMGENTTLEVYGKIVARGTNDNPIIFEPSHGYWRGVKIVGGMDTPVIDDFWSMISYGDKNKIDIFKNIVRNGNFLENCVFKKVSTKNRGFAKANKWKAAVEVYNSAISMKNSVFNDVLYIGGILGQRSYFLVDDNIISSDFMHKNINCTDNCVAIIGNNELRQKRSEKQSCADGIWINNSVGLIFGNNISNIGDDGIDSDGSRLVIYNNKINKTFDDGIDVDNGSESIIISNNIKNSIDNGILVSSKTSAIIVDSRIESSNNGIALRNGSGVAGDGIVSKDNKMGVLIFQDIPCVLSVDDYRYVVSKLLEVTDSDINGRDFAIIDNPNKLIPILENNYTRKGDYYVYVKNNFKKDVQELFKLIDIFKLEYIIGNNNYCDNSKNSLYLSNSNITNNDIDFLYTHNFQVKTENTIFSNNDNAIDAGVMDTENFNCVLIDRLNVEGVILNIKNIINEIKDV